MRRWIALGLMGFFCATAAWADMIETKKDGILNGKILSENAEEVRFKNAKGRTCCRHRRRSCRGSAI